MSEREIERWVTIRGHRVPIYKGETEKEAKKRFDDFVGTKKKESKPISTLDSVVPNIKAKGGGESYDTEPLDVDKAEETREALIGLGYKRSPKLFSSTNFVVETWTKSRNPHVLLKVKKLNNYNLRSTSTSTSTRRSTSTRKV